MFQFFCGPPEFSLMGKFVPKISIFTILGAVSPHFKAKTVKIGMSVRTWDFLFHAKFCIKKIARGIPLWGKFIPINTNFGDFRGCRPTFKSHNGEICHEGADLGLRPQATFCKSRLRGYTPFEQRGLPVLHCPAEVMHII